jgi:protease-4
MIRRCIRSWSPGRAVCATAALLLSLPGGLIGCAPASLLITPVSTNRELEEQVVLRESVWTSNRIVLLDVDGVLRNARAASLLGAGGEHPVSLLAEKLDKAADDDRVKAVVLRINSPGGSVTASDLMYEELRRFRERSGKPVIACMVDVAASGGYYIACAADRIYAHPTTVTGSIGVIAILPEVTGTMDKLGIRTNVIKSGELKDAGSPFREMNAKDEAVFRDLITRFYNRFVEVVKTSRKNLDETRIRELADGRVYPASEARANGLVDEIGTLYDAIAAAKSAAEMEQKKFLVVQYARPLSYRPNIYAEAGASPPQVNLVNVNLPDWLTGGGPQFLYLWAPGW